MAFLSEEERLAQGILSEINNPEGYVSTLGPENPRMQDALRQAALLAPEPVQPGALMPSPWQGPDFNPQQGSPMMGGPMMGNPMQAQQGPQWAQKLNSFLNSPGWAMANQAIQNRGARRRGEPVTQTPVMAAQRHANANEALMLRRARILDERERAKQAMALRMLQMSQPGKPSALEQRLGFLRTSLGLDDDENWMQDDRVRDFLTSTGSDINVDVNTAPPLAELAGAGSKNAKEDFRMNLEGIPELLNLTQFDPEFLTGMGQLGMEFNKVRDRWGTLPESEKGRYQDYVQFENRVARMFNNYRKMITGAAASPSEMEDLRQSIANMDQGPGGFQASLEGMLEDNARDLRGAIYLEATSDLSMGTPEMGERLDRLSAQQFKSDTYKDAIGDYVAEALGYDVENIGGWTADQRSAFSRYMKSLGF